MDKGKLSKEIADIRLYKERESGKRLYVFPFIIVYIAWGCYFIIAESIEYELLGFAGTVLLHILTFLFTQWSVMLLYDVLLQNEGLQNKSIWLEKYNNI